MQSSLLSSFFASFRATSTVPDTETQPVDSTAPVELKVEQLGEVGGGMGPAGTWNIASGPAGTW